MEHKKQTKIVATLGPASDNPDIMQELMVKGVNVFRLNFSHGSHQSHLKMIKQIKRIRKKADRAVAILQDLSGPKIRLGKIRNEPLQVLPNDEIILDAALESNSTGNRVGVNHPGFAGDVFPGARLLLADGNLEFKVKKVEKSQVYCKVIIGGNLFSHKGVNFPSGTFHVPSLTAKDKRDLEFGLKNGVDLVAMSFVREASDLDKVRSVFKKVGRTVPLIAKIEKHEAIENLTDIVNSADAIMVARGDLGVDIEIESVPIIQKKIIKQANLLGKPVITATQMLRSMVESPMPTRAEVTDVANAILDGTDAIMLSEETAVGKYPVKAVTIMANIAKNTEGFASYHHDIKKTNQVKAASIPDSISHSATILARDLNAKTICAITRTGYTALAIAKHRPPSCILALTPEEHVYYQLALVWGVLPVKYALQHDQNKLFEDAMKIAKKVGVTRKGDHYVFASGFPLGQPGSINQVTAGKVP
jgi:pyruvate kinase